MSEFTAKNEARKAGRDRVGREAYTKARKFRQAVDGAFGNLSKQYWRAASVGTAGENVAGGVGKDAAN